MPITPKTGSLFHAETQIVAGQGHNAAAVPLNEHTPSLHEHILNWENFESAEWTHNGHAALILMCNRLNRFWIHCPRCFGSLEMLIEADNTGALPRPESKNRWRTGIVVRVAWPYLQLGYCVGAAVRPVWLDVSGSGTT
jgi:hypothetical protein